MPGKIEAGHDFWGKSAVLLIKERSHVNRNFNFMEFATALKRCWGKFHSHQDFSVCLTCMARHAIHEVWGNMYGLLPVWGTDKTPVNKVFERGPVSARKRRTTDLQILSGGISGQKLPSKSLP